MTRFYHSFTTRYNVYFNGIENYKEQLKEMEEGYEDNFTDLLLMHPTQAYANPKEPATIGKFRSDYREMPESHTVAFH